MKNYFKNLNAILCLISLFILFPQKTTAITENELSPDSSIIVTYIGAAGFLLQTETRKVMIDAVFTRNGASGFLLPSASTINDIKENKEPFNNIDIYLIGHAHEDHFDPGMTDKCMLNNPNATLVCPQEVVDKLLALSGNNYETYKDRIIVPALNNYQSMDTTIADIGIQVTKFPAFSYHPNGLLVFNVEMNHIKAFHLMGTLLNESVYSTYEFNNTDNDILLVTSNYLENSTSILQNKLHFKVAYVHHIYQYSSKAQTYISTCNYLRTKGFQTFVLSSSLEKYRFTKNVSDLLIDTVREVTLPTSIDRNPVYGESLIFPNPFRFSASVSCNFTIGEECTINIFDVTGKNVTPDAEIVINKPNNTLIIYRKRLKCGIYLLKVENNNSFSINKFIIE